LILEGAKAVTVTTVFDDENKDDSASSNKAARWNATNVEVLVVVMIVVPGSIVMQDEFY